MPHIATLELTLGRPEDFDLNASRAASLGPFLQGALMESTDAEYAELLHGAPFNPYAQNCIPRNSESLTWRVCALDDTAYERLLLPLMSLQSIELRGAGGRVFPVLERRLETHDLKELTGIIAEDGPERIRMRFCTPTSFKSAGSYAIMPSVRLVFQNLLMRYLYVYEGTKEPDEGTIEFIEKNIRITSYNLHSEYFDHAMGKRGKVPAFAGTLGFSLKGPRQLGGLCRMLLRFGEYAGVGIKTSMGMGGMQCLWKKDQ